VSDDAFRCAAVLPLCWAEGLLTNIVRLQNEICGNWTALESADDKYIWGSVQMVVTVTKAFNRHIIACYSDAVWGCLEDE
jgi:hypothetical protein